MEWEWLLSPIKRILGDRLISVAIFGSFARGEHKEDSDLDLLVVVEGDPGDRLRLAARIALEIDPPSGYPKLVSPVVLRADEVIHHPPIMLDMVHHCLIIFDRDNFLRKEIDRLRRRLRELGARRVETEEGWYWELKPGTKMGEVIRI